MNAAAQPQAPEVIYPDSDGEPMAENSYHFDWIQTVQGNLAILFRDRPDVFVAGDNLIYPVHGDPQVRRAPDAYVAFGRPKGYRGSYMVWKEDGIFPQVVFELWSPSNRGDERERKLVFYDRYGAEEYYEFDPDSNDLIGYGRAGGRLVSVGNVHGFVSPRMGIRFATDGPDMGIYRPDGRRFLTMVELGEENEAYRRQVEEARKQLEAARLQAEDACKQADDSQKQIARSRRETDRLRAMLLAAGIDPDAVPPEAPLG